MATERSMRGAGFAKTFGALLIAAGAAAGIVVSAAAQSGSRQIPGPASTEQHSLSPALDPATRANLQAMQQALPAAVRPRLAAARRDFEGRLRTAGKGDLRGLAQGALRPRFPDATPDQLELLTALLLGEWLEETERSAGDLQPRLRRSREDRQTYEGQVSLAQEVARARGLSLRSGAATGKLPVRTETRAAPPGTRYTRAQLQQMNPGQLQAAYDRMQKQRDGAEMEMLHLQDLMSARSKAIQLATNIIRNFHRSMTAIVSNIH